MKVAAEQAVEHCNEIRLVGRVASEPRLTTLPSGDELVSVRLVVRRPAEPAGRGRRPAVDTLVCAAWAPLVRRRLRMWNPDDVVEVRGSLRRRFWRGEDGPRDRYEVEVESAVRLLRGPARRSGSVVQPVFSDG